MKFFRAGVVVAIGVVLAPAGTARGQDAYGRTDDVEVMVPGQNWGTTPERS